MVVKIMEPIGVGVLHPGEQYEVCGECGEDVLNGDIYHVLVAQIHACDGYGTWGQSQRSRCLLGHVFSQMFSIASRDCNNSDIMAEEGCLR
jgi:hypothetical protein